MSKIAFINTLCVPSGEASVNRVLSLARGLVECGDEVHILSSNVNPNFSKGEVIYGIHIFNLGKSHGVIGLANSLRQIILKLKKERYDAIISTTNSLLLIYPLVACSKMMGSKFLQEKSEFPFSLMKKGILNKIYSGFYVNTTYKLMDGMIIMTLPLMEYFKDKVRKNCQFIHIPMTVDSNRFNITKRVSELGDYVAYCGNMSGNKDGVENLIEAFSYVVKKIPNLKLLLIGGTNHKDEFDELKTKALNVSNTQIVFFGRADREQIPYLLKNARILALARPASLQSTGGFPTKLGEYLSTGNPVVVTAVGDIPNYLNDSNSYIVKPNDNNAFADAIIEAYSDISSSEMKGQNGRQLVMSVFDYKAQSKKLHTFINSLL